MWFQSPCGDLLIGNNYIGSSRNSSLSVSVPLRGFVDRKLWPSTPSNLRIGFQSPCGDLLIGNSRVTSLQGDFLLVSVPLRGFVDRKLFIVLRSEREQVVSVPLRGFVDRKPRKGS